MSATNFIRQSCCWTNIVVCLSCSIVFLFLRFLRFIWWCSLLSCFMRWSTIMVFLSILCSLPLIFLRLWIFELLLGQMSLMVSFDAILEKSNRAWTFCSYSSQICLVRAFNKSLRLLFLCYQIVKWEVIFLFGSLALGGSAAVCYL